MANGRGGREKRLQVKFREEARIEQNNLCCYCGCEMTDSDSKLPTACTAEHVVPKSWGGKACKRNIKAACLSCNGRRADGAPLQLRSGVKHERNVRITEDATARAIRKQDERFRMWRQSCPVR